MVVIGYMAHMRMVLFSNTNGDLRILGLTPGGQKEILRSYITTASRLVIDGNNYYNVGVGTGTPSEKLTVNGNIESLDTIILNYNNAGNKWQQLFDGANGWNLRYYNSSSWSSNYVNVNTSGKNNFFRIRVWHFYWHCYI